MVGYLVALIYVFVAYFKSVDPVWVSTIAFSILSGFYLLRLALFTLSVHLMESGFVENLVTMTKSLTEEAGGTFDASITRNERSERRVATLDVALLLVALSGLGFSIVWLKFDHQMTFAIIMCVIAISSIVGWNAGQFIKSLFKIKVTRNRISNDDDD